MIYESEATTPAAMQEFQNSVLGETFLPPGGWVKYRFLTGAGDYEMPTGWQKAAFMGVDVGIKLHVVIHLLVDFHKPQGRSQAVFIGEANDFEEFTAAGHEI